MPPTRSPYPAVWRDLAALLDPAGVFSDRVTPPDRDWLALFRLAAAHLVAPSLYATLAARGQLYLPPPDIRLDAVRAGDALRSYLLAAQRLFDQPLPEGVQPKATALRAEQRFGFRLNHPRLGRWLEWLTRLPRRRPNLPKRLLTPAWYPAKYRYLRQQWFPKRPSFDEGFHD